MADLICFTPSLQGTPSLLYLLCLDSFILLWEGCPQHPRVNLLVLHSAYLNLLKADLQVLLATIPQVH